VSLTSFSPYRADSCEAPLVPLRIEHPIATRAPVDVLRRVDDSCPNGLLHPGEVRIDVLNIHLDSLTDASTIEVRSWVVGRTHPHRAVAEGHLGVLDRAVSIIPANASGEPECFLEET
jgi:hypothetical protein